VISRDSRKIVLQLIIVIRLQKRERTCAQCNLVEDDGFDSFNSWGPGNNAVSTDGKALGSKANTYAPLLPAKIIVVAHVAHAEFVHNIWTERFGIAEIDQLGPAVGKSVETGHIRSALLGGIGIIQVVVVDRVIRGQCSKTRVSIQPNRTLGIVDPLSQCCC
jgi:hypothetical protein